MSNIQGLHTPLAIHQSSQESIIKFNEKTYTLEFTGLCYQVYRKYSYKLEYMALCTKSTKYTIQTRSGDSITESIENTQVKKAEGRLLQRLHKIHN